MKTLREVLADADARHVAVGHFNISELGTLKGIFAAALELSAAQSTATGATVQFPILIGVSEGEREFIGVKQVVAMVQSLREQYDYPIFLNADHTHSLDKVREAAEAGFDEIYSTVRRCLRLTRTSSRRKEAVKIDPLDQREHRHRRRDWLHRFRLGDRTAKPEAHTFDTGRSDSVYERDRR